MLCTSVALGTLTGFDGASSDFAYSDALPVCRNLAFDSAAVGDIPRHDTIGWDAGWDDVDLVGPVLEALICLQVLTACALCGEAELRCVTGGRWNFGLGFMIDRAMNLN